MKRVLTLTTLAVIFLLGSCKKEKQNDESYHPSPNRVIILPSDGKSLSNTLFVMSIGHKAENCEGCIWNNGKYIHIDCMGPGSYCSKSVAVVLNEVGSDITATTTDTLDLTSEDFFLMPDRSLNYTDENNNRVYLNIPGQMIYRDAVTRQFTFTGLFITNTPEYSNN